MRKELLQHLGVEQGQQIEVSMLPGGKIEVRAAAPAGSIDGFIGLLKDSSRKVASIEEMSAAAAAGWAGRT